MPTDASSQARSAAKSATGSVSPCCSTGRRRRSRPPRSCSVGGQLYQLVVVPLLAAPQPVAWIAAGIRIDDAMAQEMRSLTGLDVTFLSRPENGEWKARASTLAEPTRSELQRDVAANRYSSTGSDGNAEYGDDAITRVINLAPRADDGAVAVLQGSLPAALAPLREMEQRLALVALLGVAAAIVLGLALSRSIAEPLRDITAAARRVAAGDYAPIATHGRRDEVGELAAAFRGMQDRRRGQRVEDDRARAPRRADGIADEAAVRGSAGSGDRVRRARGHAGRRAGPQSRSSGTCQRDARPFDRRHAAARGCGPIALGRPPRVRQRRPHRRRRVRHPDVGLPGERCAAGRRSGRAGAGSAG